MRTHRGDQLCTYYSICLKSKRWWRRLFYYLVECAVLNACVFDGFVRPLERARKGHAKRDMLTFRLELAHSLIDGFSSRNVLAVPEVTLMLSWPVCNRKAINIGRHLNNCVVCAGKVNRHKLQSRGNLHETKYVCKHCNVHLCIASDRNCFEEYHTKVDYCACMTSSPLAIPCFLLSFTMCMTVLCLACSHAHVFCVSCDHTHFPHCVHDCVMPSMQSCTVIPHVLCCTVCMSVLRACTVLFLLLCSGCLCNVAMGCGASCGTLCSCVVCAIVMPPVVPVYVLICVIGFGGTFVSVYVLP